MTSLPSWQLALAVTAAAALAACGGDGTNEPVQISTLGNRADLISDGNALVEITLPASANNGTLTVRLNGSDVTAAFTTVTANGRKGLVQGLATGRNVIVAEAAGAKAAELVVTNAPRGGPLLAGAQPVPYICAAPTAVAATATTAAVDASGFTTAATDAQCNVATQTLYFYRTTEAGCSMANPYPSPPATAPANACFKPYTVGQAAPGDLATTTTEAGLIVPYVVRLERGVINRGIYEMAVLVDPAKPWANGLSPQASWTGKLEFIFGGSSGQLRRQLRPASLWNHDAALAKGWMVATNALVDGSRNTNRTAMVDTVIMMKEDITERYGPLKHTVASGCSAGSMSAYAIASSYPGLLDGLLVSCSLNDAESSNQESVDCGLLVEAYDKPRWRELMAAGSYGLDEINRKKAAINGHEDYTACIGWYNSFGVQKLAGNYDTAREVTAANRATGVITARSLGQTTNGCQLPASQVFDPVSNPTGLRCSQWDHAVATFGKRADGEPNSTRDNTGVQYGLKALVAGTVTAEEFVTLNEMIGSFDRNGLYSTARAVADLPALQTVYRAGLMPDYTLLAQTPILDFRGYDDSLIQPITNTGRSGLHQIWKSFANRARFEKANGTSSSYAMWRYGLSENGVSPPTLLANEGFFVMDQWITAVKASSTGTAAARVLAARPAAAADFCLLSTDAAQSTRVTDPALCDADPLLKGGMSPREAAGSPRANDLLKCQLKPLDVAEYLPAVLNADQLARMRAVFADGVCDYSKPGVGFEPARGVTSFAAGPGGQVLPAAPQSTAR
ncbi:DUF6351 family protein [Pseudorhodoferax sp.]|uniref:DUF6351 family protein n=1 Tax=Pseudorhodoferax sp. TaxID=1993553 RepID=UPI002DD64DD7|nr:DUF6351 family protein [Pseudorhodoferax sp.]